MYSFASRRGGRSAAKEEDGVTITVLKLPPTQSPRGSPVMPRAAGSGNSARSRRSFMNMPIRGRLSGRTSRVGVRFRSLSPVRDCDDDDGGGAHIDGNKYEHLAAASYTPRSSRVVEGHAAARTPTAASTLTSRARASLRASRSVAGSNNGRAARAATASGTAIAGNTRGAAAAAAAVCGRRSQVVVFGHKSHVNLDQTPAQALRSSSSPNLRRPTRHSAHSHASGKNREKSGLNSAEFAARLQELRQRQSLPRLARASRGLRAI